MEQEGGAGLAGRPGAPLEVPGGAGGDGGAGGGGEGDGAGGAGGVEQRALRVKDLDTGKEYMLEKVYRIKDLDTGKEFIVDAEAQQDRREQSLVQVGTGEQISMRQFESQLGLSGGSPEPHPGSPIGEEIGRREALEGGGRGGGGAGGREAGAGAADLEEPAGPSGGGLRPSFFRASLDTVKGRLGSLAQWPGGEGGDGGAAPGAGGGGAGPERWENSSAHSEDWAPGQPTGGHVKVHTHTKLYKELTDLRLVQEFSHHHQGAVWTMSFSLCGQYLASAGQDGVVRVWTPVEPSARGSSVQAGRGGDGAPARVMEDLFEHEPYRELQGHKADVLDLSWSKTQFLLSSSMDKTVRLWHISMTECLRVFAHSDFVTAVDFHPRDDKYFLSGSLDEKLRLWNIPDHAVADWVHVHEMVTAACFSPDGSQAVVGSFKGKCRFYNTAGMAFEYVTQVDVKSTRGANSRGKKITGLQFMPGVDRLLLVTSNDSRVRMYDGYTLKVKYKGHRNASSQIRATFSPGGGFVICGSEDGHVHMWSTINTFIPSVNPAYTGFRREKNDTYESFQSHEDIVTVSLFAPDQVRRVHKPKLGEDAPLPTKAAAALVRPDSLKLGLSTRLWQNRKKDKEAEAQKVGEAAVAAAAAVGQVIVTAGYSGKIRIFENAGLPTWL